MRGVLEVNYPIDHTNKIGRIAMFHTFGLVLLLGLLGFITVGLVLARSRRSSADLERVVELRTAALKASLAKLAQLSLLEG